MGREREWRKLRKASRAEPMRVVPSKRGLVTVFLVTAAAGAGFGLLVLHFLGPVCR